MPQGGLGTHEGGYAHGAGGAHATLHDSSSVHPGGEIQVVISASMNPVVACPGKISLKMMDYSSGTVMVPQQTPG